MTHDPSPADPPRTVLVTGATGFVGRVVCARLAAAGWRVRALTRRADTLAPDSGIEESPLGELAEIESFAPALDGCDAVVHLAARVHVMAPTEADAALFRRVNVDATRRLAEQAAAAGVAHFVFMSSIKVNGEGTPPGRAYTEADAPAPEDDYGRSKHEAEQALRAVERERGLAVTILRPPLVHGPGVRANLGALVRLADSPWPLPFGATTNRRALVGVDNLADAVATALANPAARGKTYLVRDPEEVSTGGLVRRIRLALGRPPRQAPVPAGLMRAAMAPHPRLRAMGERLFGSLSIDDSAIRRDLHWTPPVSLAEGLLRLIGGPRRLLLVTGGKTADAEALAEAARAAGWEVHVTATAETLALRRLCKEVRPHVVHVLGGAPAPRLPGVPVVLADALPSPEAAPRIYDDALTAAIAGRPSPHGTMSRDAS